MSLSQKTNQKTVALLEKIKKNNIQLLLATKTISDEEILQSALVNKNIIIGENRLQEALEKKEILQKFPNKKHFIGKLQKNKIRKIIHFFDCIQTVDSVEMLKKINRIAGEEQKKIDVFLNINISKDVKKSGMTQALAQEIIENNFSMQYPNLCLTGLFTILQFGLSSEEKHKYYKKMKQFFDNAKIIINTTSFSHLSMGMSGDYDIAIEEGSTMIRIGSLIFGKR